MISAAGKMQPLPVRPLDGPRTPGTPAPLQARASGRTSMQPLPFPKPEAADFVAAIRDAAFRRLVERTDMQPLPVTDPTT